MQKTILFSTLLITALAIQALALLPLNAQELATPQTSRTQTYLLNLTPPAGPIPSNYFGLHIEHLIDYSDTAWPNVGFGMWRLWDAHVAWNDLEPQPGQYDFSLLDQYVALAQKNNVDLILTLAITPPWAANGATGGTHPPANVDYWRAFVSTVATRYAGKIRYYEIWNEPDHSAWFSGTAYDYLTLLKVAYSAIKAADSQSQVLGPVVHADPIDITWLNQFLTDGGGQYIDIFTYHLYVGLDPESMVFKTQRLQTLLAQYGQGNKQIWDSEAGWPFYQMNEEVSTQYVARSYIVHWALGLRRYSMYAWDDPHFGIAPRGGDTPLSAAYDRINQWLQNATMSRCVELSNGVWLANLTMPDRTSAKLAWYPDGTTQLDPSHVLGAYEYETLNGDIVSVKSDGANVSLSPSPILLRYPSR